MAETRERGTETGVVVTEVYADGVWLPAGSPVDADEGEDGATEPASVPARRGRGRRA